MITRIPNPAAVDHDLVGGKWPHAMRPVTVHFARRQRKRRTNVTEALTRLAKMPPCILYKGCLYLPDPKAPGGTYQEKHTEREYVWLVKRWLKLPEGTEAPAGLSVKPIAQCEVEACGRIWVGEGLLCPPCKAKAAKVDAKPKAKGKGRKKLKMKPLRENVTTEVAVTVELETIPPVGRHKTEPPPPSDTEPPPDTQSSPGGLDL